jgi:hypothetical protein
MKTPRMMTVATTVAISATGVWPPWTLMASLLPWMLATGSLAQGPPKMGRLRLTDGAEILSCLSLVVLTILEWDAGGTIQV